jgi:hypothetical protein
MTNTFWIAGNILFDLNTGKKTDVLMLVNHEVEASFFKRVDADAYRDFVAARAPNITWIVEATNLRGSGMFVIKGVQNV